MAELTSPLADWSAGAIYQADIDGHPVTIAIARRGPHTVEGILRDNGQEFRAKADLLLDQHVPSIDVLTNSLIEQWRLWREAAGQPDIWSVLRAEE